MTFVASQQDRSSITALPVFLIAGAFALLAVMWAYYGRGIAFTNARLNAAGFPQTRYFSDLYPRWLGSREFFLRHKDPYSAEVTSEIQRGYYGRPIDPTRRGDPVDEQRFAYPLYIIFFFAPTVLLRFPTALLILELLLWVFAVWSVSLWSKALSLNFSWPQWLLAVPLALSTLPFLQGLHLQQLSILVAFFLAAAMAALARGRLASAGVLLALATIKPQLAAPLIGFAAIWTLGDWRHRRRLLVAWLVTMALLIAASAALMPAWPIEFIRGLTLYMRYTNAASMLQAMLGSRLGTFASLLAIFVVILICWRTRRASPDSMPFKAAFCVALACACTTIPSLAPHNQVLLLPAFLLLAFERRPSWCAGRLPRALYLACWGMLVWTWASALFVMAATPLANSFSIWSLPIAVNPFMPVIPFVFLLIVSAQTALKRDALSHAVAP